MLTPVTRMQDIPSRAVVLLSGGIDSATCLAAAKAAGHEAHAISFDYGQRHKVELLCAARVAHQLGAASHRVIPIDLRAIGGSALVLALLLQASRGVLAQLEAEEA
jgi:7-cyano-7-deazaguanine synthase